ncbi:hypothetical protein C2G38_2148205 [Gigaspora rosea]|uniref:BTB domain-containing protein n=1 Tax=Gigaspora rosea TaxID=44941 RepID=A0A397UG23_9GLOM|nr:hypothetical protein C2G38_2148205 [Gigaspora rosea]
MVNLKYVSTQQFEIIIKSLYFRNELANINSDENNVKTVNLKHVSTQQFESIINIKFFEKLSNIYLELLNDEEDFNIIINVGEPPNTKIFRAGSIVLKYRSLYFRNELANINSDENYVKMVNLKHVSTQQFEIIIKPLYFRNKLANINSDKNNIKMVNLNMFLPNNLKSLSKLAECLEAFLIIDR